MPQDIPFISVLRATACLLVVYAHLIGYRAPKDWFVKPYLDQLGFTWHFGYFGVALFFLVSGFIVVHVAQNETRGSFITKRFFRIFPPVWAALLLAAAISVWSGASWFDVTPESLAAEMSIFGSNFELIGPTYTLVMELMFYMLVACMLTTVQTRPGGCGAVRSSHPRDCSPGAIRSSPSRRSAPRKLQRVRPFLRGRNGALLLVVRSDGHGRHAGLSRGIARNNARANQARVLEGHSDRRPRVRGLRRCIA